MMRIAYSAVFLSFLMVLLSGCQSAKTAVDAFDVYKVLQKTNAANTVYLSCGAGQGCDFARVNDVIIIDDVTSRPTKQAIERGMVRIEGSVFSHHQYAVSLMSGEQEVSLRFYPVSSERAEKFHIIHNFLAGHRYKLVMYRQKSANNGSLLNVAMPGPLCVDLLQDEITYRRFCRPFDAMTGLGEFIEQKI